MEKHEQRYDIEADSPEEAIKIADQARKEGCGHETPIFGQVQQINGPKYLEDCPQKDWVVYGEDGREVEHN
jgi:hypothetical protein